MENEVNIVRSMSDLTINCELFVQNCSDNYKTFFCGENDR